MRECPKCHYVDPPQWRHPFQYPDFDYMRYDEFQDVIPELAKGMRPNDLREDELHMYRRVKTGKYVYRIWKPYWKALGGGAGEGWSKFRQTKMYDSSGRTRKDTWAKVLKAMNSTARYRKTAIKLDAWNGEGVS